MTGTKEILDRFVCFGPLVLISDEEAYRRPERPSLEDSAENFDPIGFLPRCRHGALTRTAPIELLLDVFFREREIWPHAIDEHADPLPMALSKRRDANDAPQGITSHSYSSDSNLLNSSQNPGNDFVTQRGFLMPIPSTRKPASAKHIAIR